ncbi:MAG: hypothetical protein AB1330_12530 [Bacillota bacterium]
MAFFLVIGFMIQGMISYSKGGFWFFYPDTYSAYLAYLSAIGSGLSAYFVGILPLAACLVAGDSMAWDRKTGFIRFVLTRSSRRTYILGKITAVTLLTGIVIFSGLLISFLIASIWFPLALPPWHMVGETATFTNPAAPPAHVFPFPNFLHDLLFSHPFVYILVVGGVVTLSAIVWANLAMLISLWTTKIYLVLAGPWLAYIGGTFIFGVLGLIMDSPLVSYAPLVLSGAFIGHGKEMTRVEIPFIWIGFTTIVTYTAFMRRKDVLD